MRQSLSLVLIVWCSMAHAERAPVHRTMRPAGIALIALATTTLVASSVISYYSANGPFTSSSEVNGPRDRDLALAGGLMIVPGAVLAAAAVPTAVVGMDPVVGRGGRRRLIAGAVLTSAGAALVV